MRPFRFRDGWLRDGLELTYWTAPSINCFRFRYLILAPRYYTATLLMFSRHMPLTADLAGVHRHTLRQSSHTALLLSTTSSNFRVFLSRYILSRFRFWYFITSREWVILAALPVSFNTAKAPRRRATVSPKQVLRFPTIPRRQFPYQRHYCHSRCDRVPLSAGVRWFLPRIADCRYFITGRVIFRGWYCCCLIR